MEDLVVPQREVRVSVHLLDGRDLTGQMFVPAVGPDGEPGHLIDRLNQESEEFLALKEQQKTHLIHETKLLTVEIDDDEVEDRVEREIESSPGSRHLLVKIHLVSGADVIGNLAYVQPHEHERLQDYLNIRKRFIPVRVRDKLVYVNRQQITSVLALRGDER